MIRNINEVAQLAQRVTKDDAAHVLYHFRVGGWAPGRFTTQLLEAISCADPINRAKLEKGFPGECAAMKIAMEVPEGLEILKQLFEEGPTKIQLMASLGNAITEFEEEHAEQKRQAWRERYGTEPPADNDF